MSGMAHMFMIGGAIARHLLLDRGDIYSGYLNLLAVRAALEPNFKKRRSILVTSLAWILSEESILSYGASIGAPSIASTESDDWCSYLTGAYEFMEGYIDEYSKSEPLVDTDEECPMFRGKFGFSPMRGGYVYRNELLQKQQDIRRAIDEAETKKQVGACVSTWLGNDRLM